MPGLPKMRRTKKKAFRAEKNTPELKKKTHKPSRAELKILQLELWLEPARLGLITISLQRGLEFLAGFCHLAQRRSARRRGICGATCFVAVASAWERFSMTKSLPVSKWHVRRSKELEVAGRQKTIKCKICQICIFFRANALEWHSFLPKPMAALQFNAVHKGAFWQFTFRWIYYCHSSESTGNETGKTHLCAVQCNAICTTFSSGDNLSKYRYNVLTN